MKRELAAAAIAMGIALGLVASVAADNRSTVRFQYSCRNDLSGRDVTLFANGTVRLREGLWDDRQLYLEELRPEELTRALQRLDEIHRGADRRSTSLPTEVAEGRWVENCELRLELPDAEPWAYEFSPYEVPPLELASLIQVAEDLAELTRPLTARDRIPAGYRPQPGDVLRTAEGERFRVVRPTTDGRGIELEGLDNPLLIFVDLTAIGEAFTALEESSRASGRGDIGLPEAPDAIDP